MEGKKNGKGVGKNGKTAQIKGLIMSKEEFNKILGTSGSKNNYKELVKELREYRDMGAYAKVYSFQELAEKVGCKCSDGAMRNLARYIENNYPDIVIDATVRQKSQLVGFVFKK